VNGEGTVGVRWPVIGKLVSGSIGDGGRNIFSILYLVILVFFFFFFWQRGACRGIFFLKKQFYPFMFMFVFCSFFFVLVF
jgi:hypothetical protein